MQPTLSDLETMARQAGQILRESFGQRHKITYKGVIDLVTEADKRSEAFLLGEIQQRFPGDRILSEESGDLDGENSGMWLIDPLDGTINYAHGVPIYTVSVAYAKNGVPMLGVVYDPSLDECFSAEQGAGARRNGYPIRVSATPDLNHSLLVTGFPYDIRTNPANNLEQFTRFSLRSQGVRRLGSAAMDLCYIACGRLDGFWEIRLSPWDLAAGVVIAEEAGARVTSVNGDTHYMKPPYSIMAANPRIHAQMLEVMLEIQAEQ